MTLEPNVLTPEPSVVRDAFWYTGFDDGRVGQTWLEHERILQGDAQQEQVLAVASRQQQLERSKADLEIANAAFTREQQEYESIRNRHRDGVEDSDKNPTQYSRPMAVVFCALAVAILVADLPLAVAISSEIIRQREGADPWFVAAGIVAMGLFFKIIADPFMRPRYLLHRVLRPFTWGVTAVLAILIVVLLSTVLGLLGIFRGGAVTRQHVQPPEVTYGASTSTAPPASTTPPAPGGIVEKLQHDFAALQMGFIAKVAFLALALALPILGGIFASTGTARWHNRQQLERLEARLAARQAAYDTAIREMHEQTATVATAERELKSAQQHAPIRSVRYFTYLHGYERGMCDAAAVDGRISDAVLNFVRRWLTIARQRENLLRTTAIAKANPTMHPPAPTREG